MLMAASHTYAQPQFRDAATSDELAKRARQASINSPLGKLNPKQIDPQNDPTKVNQPQDLIATSDFLSFGQLSTLIPKRSILHIPQKYQNRMKFVRGTRIVTWPNFYPANRGWIKTIEVTREQAQGKEPFDEKVAQNLARSSNVVVAVYQNGPISVLPYKDPEAAEPQVEEKNKTTEEIKK